MCGRFNVIDDPITQSILEILGIDFTVTTNDNVCPSELVSTLSFTNGKIAQINANWGIKPDWANKLIINAQSETVHSKKTFKDAFLNHRCIIPLSGWYEWKASESGKKQKYLFNLPNQTLFMAGVLFEDTNNSESKRVLDLFDEEISNLKSDKQFVSLTTKPTAQCSEIHSRMPLLIPGAKISNWLEGNINDIGELLTPQEQHYSITSDA